MASGPHLIPWTWLNRDCFTPYQLALDCLDPFAKQAALPHQHHLPLAGSGFPTRGPALLLPEEAVRRNTHRKRELRNRIQAYAVELSLQGAHVCSVNVGSFRQCLLRHASLQPQATQVASECAPDFHTGGEELSMDFPATEYTLQ